MARALDPAIVPTPDPPVGTSGTVTWLPGAASPPAGSGDHADPTANGAELIRETVAARTALREAAAAATAAATRALLLADLLDEALAHLPADETTGPPPALAVAGPVGVTSLSRREREVLALVVEGRTNKEIAGALFLSPNTVKTHITSLLHKLRVDSRVRLAAIAMEQSLHQPTGRGSR